MKTQIMYTDLVGCNLWLDTLTDLEYFSDVYGIVWLSRDAGDILVRSLGKIEDIDFIKR